MSRKELISTHQFLEQILEDIINYTDFEDEELEKHFNKIQSKIEKTMSYVDGKLSMLKQPPRSPGRSSGTRVNPYIKFSIDERKKIKNEHPDWSLNKVTIEISKRWKNLSREDKDSYV